jgi:cell division protein ZipA
MAELRWILVGIGLAILAAVYLWSRRRSAHRAENAPDGRIEPRLEHDDRPEPQLGADDDWPGEPLLEDLEVERVPRGETGLLFEDLPVPGEEGRGRAAAAGGASGAPERILVVHIHAVKERGFAGPDLVAALETEGLEYEEPGVYVQPSNQGQAHFTIANMFEPGTIPRDAPEDFFTHGITAFMVLPGPGTAETLARMVALSRRLAARLGGEVLDETGSTLTNQRATHMREEVIEFKRRFRIAQGEH